MSTTGQIFVAALRSIASAATMAMAGVYLSRSGVITASTRKALSKISMKMTIPCLLFSSMLDCTQNWSPEPCPSISQTVGRGWPLLLLPAVNVGVGAALGYLIVRLTRPPRDFERAAVVAVAFGNSTGLPITLLSTIHASFGPLSELGQVNPVLFLSVYLLLYPLLQWTVAARLLGVDEELAQQQQQMQHQQQQQHQQMQMQTLKHDEAVGALANTKPLLDHIDAAATTGSSCSSHQFLQAAWWHRACRGFLKPPVVAVLAAMLLAVTPLQGWMVDTKDRDNDAPLEWLFNALVKVGEAAVPINMIILGCSLSQGMRMRPPAVPWSTNIGIAFAKLVLMPAFGILTAVVLHGAGVTLGNGAGDSFYLVVMIVTCTPTANSLLVMAELAGQNRAALAACIFTQYAIAPLVLTCSVSIFVAIATKF